MAHLKARVALGGVIFIVAVPTVGLLVIRGDNPQFDMIIIALELLLTAVACGAIVISCMLD